MNFNSGAFLIFLPTVVLIYWLLPHKARKFWVLAASYFFYMYWNPLLILLLLASTAVDYFCGRGIERFSDNPTAKKALLLCSVCMNLGMLFFFKYWDFFADNVNRFCAWLSIPYTVPALSLILPVGISFYTFQTMSYTIDVYRGDFHAEKDPITFALYVTYFPQLVAGPIENPRNLLPQLKAEQRFSSEDFQAGIRLLISGFFRKCVVADFCGIYVNAVYNDLSHANGFALACAGLLFCMQLYCDFAGYSEIAAGAARLMGIRLMKNFDQPYLSQSYTEMMRHWHISLNRWFTSYVYIPLGGNRRGIWCRLRNTIIVMALCGLWHGARWTYVIWGLYAAFWLCLESVCLKPVETALTKRGVNLKHPLIVTFRRSYMLLIYLFGSLVFRSHSMEEFTTVFSRLFTTGFSITEAFSQMGINGYVLVQLALTLVAAAKLNKFGVQDLAPATTPEAQMNRTVSIAYFILIIACCWLALLATQDTTTFAYFQF